MGTLVDIQPEFNWNSLFLLKMVHMCLLQLICMGYNKRRINPQSNQVEFNFKLSSFIFIFDRVEFNRF